MAKKYELVRDSVRLGRYPDFSELIRAVDKFRDYTNPCIEIENDSYYGDCDCYILISGTRLETDAEREVRLERLRTMKANNKKARDKKAEEEKATLRKLLEKYPEEKNA